MEGLAGGYESKRVSVVGLHQAGLKEEARNESLRCLLVLLRFWYHLLGLCYCPILKPRAVGSLQLVWAFESFFFPFLFFILFFSVTSLRMVLLPRWNLKSHLAAVFGQSSFL